LGGLAAQGRVPPTRCYEQKSGNQLKKIRNVAFLIAVFALSGCAHPIQIAPNSANIYRTPSDAPKISATVGMVMPATLNSLEVTTPGGGGDNVRYFPYRDMEAGYEKMLSNVFENVVTVTSSDSASLSRNGISFTVTPEVITDSGSTGFFTWPPTNFTVDMTTVVRDTNGKVLANPRVIGNGQATGFSDFKGDFGIAGRCAMEDALNKMQHALLEQRYVSAVSGPTSYASPVAPNDAKDAQDDTTARLDKLKGMLQKGLITQADYDQKKKEILSRF
jgi:hypothetical protein